MNESIDGELEFFELLKMLAKLTKFEVDSKIVAFYDKLLAPLGYERVNEALETLCMEAMAGGKFPSVAQIKTLVTGELSATQAAKKDDSDARLAASAIIAACSRYGLVNGTDEGAYDKMRQIRDFVGELGWIVISHRSGWNHLCGSITNDNMATVEAQMRELAKGISERLRKGHEIPGGDVSLRIGPPKALGSDSAISEADYFPPHIAEILKRREKEKNSPKF